MSSQVYDTAIYRKNAALYDKDDHWDQIVFAELVRHEEGPSPEKLIIYTDVRGKEAIKLRV